MCRAGGNHSTSSGEDESERRWQEQMGKAGGDYSCCVPYVEMRSYVAGGETTIMFPSGVYFLSGNSSKECVVGVLPGKNMINKLLEYSTFFPPKGNMTPAGKKPENMFSGKGSRGPPILVHN
jgi:hypothetical protein